MKKFTLLRLYIIKIYSIPWMRVEINSSNINEYANTSSTISQDKRYITSNFALKGYQKLREPET